MYTQVPVFSFDARSTSDLKLSPDKFFNILGSARQA